MSLDKSSWTRIFVHLAVRCHTATHDMLIWLGFELSNHFEIWKASWQQTSVKFQSDMIVLTPNHLIHLAVSFMFIFFFQKLKLEQSFTDHSHVGCIKTVAVSPKGVLASGSSDEMIRIYNLKTRQEMGTLAHHNGKYRKISNERHTLVGNKIVDHSDVVGASPVGAAPTTSSFST